MSKHIAAAVTDIPPGTSRTVTLRGREIAIFNVKGEFFAFLNKCPHEGAKLCHGAVVGLVESDEPGSYRYTRKGEFLRCPWHGWEFDLRTGQSWCSPGRIGARAYPTTVENGSELVKGPYVAETFDVEVANDYVMVDV